ncbi:MAG: hypothetical protein ASARMPREDX12_001686 [Alectoria sarmentosa]|nr:MAG: hypothetical protein ASARMPREDX12_001686 [Alectoria sarmentosa]
MHNFPLVSTVVITCFALTALAATVPIQGDSASIIIETELSPPSAALNTLNLTTQTSPWPKVPWAYQIPGFSPQHLLFEEISPQDTGLEGQQSTLHTCDEIVRWLWENYKADQNVDQACVQTSIFHGKREGHVVMVFIPITVGGEIDRELALVSVRALEGLVWRYGGHSLECEIMSGGKPKGRISISIKVSKAQNVVRSDAVAMAGSI